MCGSLLLRIFNVEATYNTNGAAAGATHAKNERLGIDSEKRWRALASLLQPARKHLERDTRGIASLLLCPPRAFMRLGHPLKCGLGPWYGSAGVYAARERRLDRREHVTKIRRILLDSWAFLSFGSAHRHNRLGGARLATNYPVRSFKELCRHICSPAPMWGVFAGRDRM